MQLLLIRVEFSAHFAGGVVGLDLRWRYISAKSVQNLARSGKVRNISHDHASLSKTANQVGRTIKALSIPYAHLAEDM